MIMFFEFQDLSQVVKLTHWVLECRPPKTVTLADRMLFVTSDQCLNISVLSASGLVAGH